MMYYTLLSRSPDASSHGETFEKFILIIHIQSLSGPAVATFDETTKIKVNCALSTQKTLFFREFSYTALKRVNDSRVAVGRAQNSLLPRIMRLTAAARRK